MFSSSWLGQDAYVQSHSSQAARRDQNRIAQREFRLRKQQKVGRQRVCIWYTHSAQIRDLETRVEILSGGTDQALTEMKNMLKGASHIPLYSQDNLTQHPPQT